MTNNHGDGFTKKFICKKLENDIFKCNYMQDWTYYITLNELFYYNQKMNKKYNIKLILEDPNDEENLLDFEKDYNDYEEIKFERITKSSHLFDLNLKNNFSVKKIDIDKFDGWGGCDKKDIKYFINNIGKFLSLREINISISHFSYKFDSEVLNMLIEVLSTLKSLDIINIKIYNPEINIAEISSKSFDKMDIKKEKGYVSIFYDNFLNKIKLKNKK